MTYKELYEAIKPFALDKVYKDDIIVIRVPFLGTNQQLRVVEVTDDGEVVVN